MIKMEKNVFRRWNAEPLSIHYYMRRTRKKILATLGKGKAVERAIRKERYEREKDDARHRKKKHTARKKKFFRAPWRFFLSGVAGAERRRQEQFRFVRVNVH